MYPTSRLELGIDELVGTTIDDADELFELEGKETNLVSTASLLSGFHEFIAINRSENSVLVLVTSQD